MHTKDSPDYMSLLAIESTLAVHSGNYTCQARNSAGTTLAHAQLQVHGEQDYMSLFVIESALIIQVLDKEL